MIARSPSNAGASVPRASTAKPVAAAVVIELTFTLR
jgi:hypothetical protein